MPVFRDSRDGRWRWRKTIKLADGRKQRMRGTPQINTKEAALEHERQAILRAVAPQPQTKEVPTLKVFAQEFMATYAATNNKPSEQRAKECILAVWLLPKFGSRRLDQIKMRDVEALKAAMLNEHRSPKRINNVLTVLGRILRYAAEVELVESVPRIKFVKVPPQRYDFLDFDELDRLLEAAKADPEIRAAVLLGADAGLRSGEIKGLDWGDLDFKVGLLRVERSLHRGILTSPKSNRARVVPMTRRLAEALKAIRHLKSDVVLCQPDGSRYTRHELDWRLKKVCKRAGLRWTAWHSLRHTFCSHLAMRGASPRAIQELAGHSSLGITQRYMHLTPGAAREAIGLLEAPRRGHSVATDHVASGESEVA